MKLRDCIDPKISWSIQENASEVDGDYIIGKVKGQFFVPDGVSRNNRYYSRNLWDRVVNEGSVKEKMRNRLMFGTIGHDAILDDEAVREGLISHVVTKLEIDDSGRGIGEALILNTPTGKILNTMLRSKVNLFVSSRADGDFDGKHEGIPKVNEDTYELEGFDFVVNPGFLQANPAITESLEKDLNKLNQLFETETNNNKKKEVINIMLMNETKKALENVTEENKDLQHQIKDLQTKIVSLEEKLKEDHNTKMSDLRELGDTPEEIKDTIQGIATLIDVAKDLDKKDDDDDKDHDEKDAVLTITTESLKKALKNIKECARDYKILKKHGGIKKVMSEYLNSSRVLGHLNTKLFNNSKKLTKQDVDLLAESMNASIMKTSGMKFKEDMRVIDGMARKFKVSTDIICKMYGTMTEAEITKFFNEAQKSVMTERKLSVRKPKPKNENRAFDKDLQKYRKTNNVIEGKVTPKQKGGTSLMESIFDDYNSKEIKK